MLPKSNKIINYAKKDFKIRNGGFTYIQKRACKQCAAPIYDQAHKSQIFCEITYDENGKVRDCKTAYHRANDKPERERQALLNAQNKALKSRIEYLVSQKGNLVTTEMLDTYDIDLAFSIQYSISKQGILKSIFLGYEIESNPFNNLHKISNHDQ